MVSEDGQTQTGSVQYLQIVLFAKERDLRVVDPSQSFQLKQSSVTEIRTGRADRPVEDPSLEHWTS